MSEFIEPNGLFSKQQIEAVKSWFDNNPSATKLSRKQEITSLNGDIITIPYSVKKYIDENGKPQYIALFRAYRRNRGQRPSYDAFGDKKRSYGKGAYGFVKGGQNIETGENVAIKRYFQGEMQDFASLLIKVAQEEEGLKKTKLYKSNVLRARDTDPQGKDAVYTVMKVIPGASLKDRDRLISPFSDEDKLKVMLNILEATKQMHGAGVVVHRDLGKQNILVEGVKGATITDFGLSVYTDNQWRFPYRITQQEDHYVAPETRWGAVEEGITKGKLTTDRDQLQYISSAADVYSLGYEFNKWLDFFEEKNQEILDNLVEKMMKIFPQQRPSLEECIQKTQAILLQNYLNNNKLDDARELLKSSPNIAYSSKALFTSCKDKGLIVLNQDTITQCLQGFVRQGETKQNIMLFVLQNKGVFDNDEIANSLPEQYRLLVQGILSNNNAQIRAAFSQLSVYKCLAKIQQVFLVRGLGKFKDNDITELPADRVYEEVAHKISNIKDLDDMFFVLKELKETNQEVFKNVILRINILERINTSDPYQTYMQVDDLVDLIRGTSEKDALSFFLNQKNLESIKKLVPINPGVLQSIASVFSENSNEQTKFLSSFSEQELMSCLRTFNDFITIYFVLKNIPNQQAQFLDLCIHQHALNISTINEFVVACKCLPDQQKSTLINTFNFSDIFIEAEGFMSSLMLELSREEIVTLLKNGNFLQSIKGDMLSQLFNAVKEECGWFSQYARVSECYDLLVKFVDVLVYTKTFTIQKLLELIQILPEDQKKNFLWQKEMLNLIKDSIHSPDDLIQIVNMVPQEDRQNFIKDQLGLKEKTIINLYTNCTSDKQKKQLSRDLTFMRNQFVIADAALIGQAEPNRPASAISLLATKRTSRLSEWLPKDSRPNPSRPRRQDAQRKPL